jgi:periplasmic divalent cation tolerance protein
LAAKIRNFTRMEARFVYITCGSQAEALNIGTALVEARLAACVNLLPGMISLYRWQGEVQQDQECVLIAKTTAACLPALTKQVQDLHSYELPCVVALPLVGGNPDFLQWIGAEVAEPKEHLDP